MAGMLRRAAFWIVLPALVCLISAFLACFVPHGKPLQAGYALVHEGMNLTQVQDSLGPENPPLLIESERLPPDGIGVQTIVTWDDGRNQVRIIFGSDGQAKTLSIGQSGAESFLRRMLDALGW
jgi:hypothetical protein